MTLAGALATRIQICGPLVIERGGHRLEARLPGRQGRLAFAYLVTRRDRPVSRDELAEALWPDDPPPRVDAVLNPLLSKLRGALGGESLESRSTVRLNLPGAWVDLEAAGEAVHRAESSVAQGDWVRAWGPSQVALFIAEREVLGGEGAPWIDELRYRLADVRVRALECYAAAELGVGGAELAGAVRAGRQLVRLAPLRESGYCYLMEALAAEGNVAEALHVYGALCDTLGDQLGIAPGPRARDLYDQLLSASG
ncbi:MAG: BTAD domain-containing putative transcriptional regulator [Acidimicrobiales bacterium]